MLKLLTGHPQNNSTPPDKIQYCKNFPNRQTYNKRHFSQPHLIFGNQIKRLVGIMGCHCAIIKENNLHLSCIHTLKQRAVKSFKSLNIYIQFENFLKLSISLSLL